MFKRIKRMINKGVSLFKKAANAVKGFFANVKAMANYSVAAVQNSRAEGYVDTGVKILIAVVIGALLLALLYTLFNTNIMPTVTAKVQSLFNYKGK